jgi:hypothetical protein
MLHGLNLVVLALVLVLVLVLTLSMLESTVLLLHVRPEPSVVVWPLRNEGRRSFLAQEMLVATVAGRAPVSVE